MRAPFRLAPDPFDERAAPPPPPPGGSDERRGGDTGEGGAEWWSPPRSPFGLLEEILWSDEWKLLVACMMLNCTTRLQVDRVLWRLFLLVPTPEDAVRLGADDPDCTRLPKVLHFPGQTKGGACNKTPLRHKQPTLQRNPALLCSWPPLLPH